MKRVVFIILITLIILFFSPVLGSKIVHNKGDLVSVKFGLPIYFIDQDQSRYDPPYPYTVKMVSFYESPLKIIWLNLLIDFLLVGGVLHVMIEMYNSRKK